MKEFFKKIHTDSFKWHDSILLLVVIFFAIMIVGDILSSIIWTTINKIGGNTSLSWMLGMYYSFIASWIVIIALCFAVKKYRFIPGTFLKGMKGNNWKMFLVGLLVGCVMNGICILSAILNKDIAIYFDSFKPLPLLVLFVGVVVQSGAEEVLCRGFVYQNLLRSYRNPLVAILMNAFIFAALHLANPGVTPVAIANIAIVGVFFSLLVYYLDSIWAAIAAHAAWNYTQNIIAGLPNSGIVSEFSVFKLDAASATNSFFYNVDFGVEGTLMATIVTVVACVVVCVVGKRKK